MDEISRSVGNNIKNGNYFEDAREWYCHMFLYPVTERTLGVAVAALSALFLVYSYFNALLVFPLTKTVPIATYLPDTISHYPVITPIEIREGQSDSQAIAQYLVTEYVRTYESYDSATMEQQAKRIEHASSRKVLRQFRRLYDITNPMSPQVLYKKNATRSVTIGGAHFVPQRSEELNKQVVIDFTTALKHRFGKTKIQKWRANMYFQLYNMEKIAKEGGKLEFTVLGYEVKEIL